MSVITYQTVFNLREIGEMSVEQKLRRIDERFLARQQRNLGLSLASGWITQAEYNEKWLAVDVRRQELFFQDEAEHQRSITINWLKEGF